jgi:hypothetical protein
MIPSSTQITKHYNICRTRVSYNKPYITSGCVFTKNIHLVIKYKKGNTYKLEYMLSWPPTSNITYFRTFMHLDPFTHDAYKEAYIEDGEFKEVF